MVSDSSKYGIKIEPWNPWDRCRDVLGHNDIHAERSPAVREWGPHDPKSDDFRYNAVGTTHIIQSGHMTACWKGESLNYIGKLVLDLF